jgi:hypothetical protein
MRLVKIEDTTEPDSISKVATAPGPLGTKQQRLSRQCEDCAAQIGIGTKLAGEYREAEAADLIYLFMRELFHEVTGSVAPPEAERQQEKI